MTEKTQSGRNGVDSWATAHAVHKDDVRKEAKSTYKEGRHQRKML